MIKTYFHEESLSFDLNYKSHDLNVQIKLQNKKSISLILLAAIFIGASCMRFETLLFVQPQIKVKNLLHYLN